MKMRITTNDAFVIVLCVMIFSRKANMRLRLMRTSGSNLSFPLLILCAICLLFSGQLGLHSPIPITL